MSERFNQYMSELKIKIHVVRLLKFCEIVWQSQNLSVVELLDFNHVINFVGRHKVDRDTSSSETT